MTIEYLYMGDAGHGVKTKEKTTAKVQKPKQYKVVLLNDDYTPMDFVVAVLESIFQKSPAEAVRIMLQVHNAGQGVCGIYSEEIAETKVHQVHQKAKANGHPLKCAMEET